MLPLDLKKCWVVVDNFLCGYIFFVTFSRRGGGVDTNLEHSKRNIQRQKK